MSKTKPFRFYARAHRLSDWNLTYAGGPSKMDGFGVVESPETWTWKPAAYAYQSLTHLDNCAASVCSPYVGSAVLSAIIVTTAVRVCWGGIDKFKSLESRID